jgi:phosphoribosylformylglycinamidine synthase
LAEPIVAAETLFVLGVSVEHLERELRAHGLALKVQEVRRIADALGRDPTLVEAHAFDAQWSEHCSYKSSRHFLKRLPTEGPTVMQGPQEDAGIVHLGAWQGKNYGIVIAHESHNHPSQVVPFEGAATGVGGIVRDVLCMGARVIALADPLRFGPQDDPHCRYVAQGVIDGIAAYGNAIGVPNIAGDVYFHEGFRDNALVNVVALGLVEQEGIIHSHAPPGADGWDIVLVGKATDRSGFGGAAFSSLVLDEDDAEQNKGAVQVPDPFLKNVIMRASYRVFDVIRERGLTVGFKDLGAGGIMGCTAEITSSGGFGAIVDLDKCPTSQDDLPPAVIAVGETQERLTWVVPPEFTSELLAIYNEEFSLPLIASGAQAAVIGKVTAKKEYVLLHHGEEVMHVDIDFLTAGIRYDRPYDDPAEPSDAGASVGIDKPIVGQEVILSLILGHRDVCSRKPLFERFDSVVRGTTSIPCGYADAGVIVPIEGAPLGCALSVDGNPRYAVIDPRGAAEHAVCEAVRNVVAVGARPAGLTDCLNYGNPEDPRQMGEFVAGIDGIARAARELGVPFVSGNVSLYNQSSAGRAVPASPIIACVGTIADISRSATMGFKRAGSALYRLGAMPTSIGGSVASEVMGELLSDGAFSKQPLPAIDYAALRSEIAALLAAHENGLVLSAHDVSDGGTLVAIAEMAFASGCTIGVELDAELSLLGAFGETGSFVVETAEPAAFETLCRAHGAAFERLGTTISNRLLIGRDGLRETLDSLHAAWSWPFRDFYAEAPEFPNQTIFRFDARGRLQ